MLTRILVIGMVSDCSEDAMVEEQDELGVQGFL